MMFRTHFLPRSMRKEEEGMSQVRCLSQQIDGAEADCRVFLYHGVHLAREYLRV